MFCSKCKIISKLELDDAIVSCFKQVKQDVNLKCETGFLNHISVEIPIRELLPCRNYVLTLNHNLRLVYMHFACPLASVWSRNMHRILTGPRSSPEV